MTPAVLWTTAGMEEERPSPCTKAQQIRTTGMPALLIVEAHVSTRDGALVAVVKGIQVVEGKAPLQPPVTAQGSR